MKKISVFILILALGLAQIGNAQKSFYAGAFVLSANYGVDGNIANQHYFNQAEGTAQTLNGSAPASNFNITGEFGLLNWLGLGIIGRFDNYYVQNNQLTNTKPSAGAVDVGATGNIHLIRFGFLDLFAGYDWGFSQLTYRVNDGLNTTAHGSGHWSDIHATGRIYFGRLGVNASVYVPMMTYSSLQNNHSTAGEYIVNYWKSTGYGASVGIQYRLF